MPVIEKVILVALATTFLLTLLEKWEVKHIVQTRSRFKLLRELFSCDFCLSWWIGLAIVLPSTHLTETEGLAIIFGNSIMVAIIQKLCGQR